VDAQPARRPQLVCRVRHHVREAHRLHARGVGSRGPRALALFLDFVSHRPDLPLAPGATKVGLGLWYSVPATIVVETVLFVVGAVLYAMGTRSRTRAGTIGQWTMLVLLVAMYAANILGPPPPSSTAIGVAGLLLLGLRVVGGLGRPEPRDHRRAGNSRSPIDIVTS
jgi:hypothetical protein